MKSSLLAVSITLGLTTSALATGPGPSARYRVTAIPSPALTDPACLPGHQVRTVPWGINDFGSVAADYFCYIVGPAAPDQQSFGRGLVWSPLFGNQVMPLPADTRGIHAQSVNNLGQVFVRELANNGDAYGGQWAPYGAYQRNFVAPPECGAVDGAAAGSVWGYSVGWGLRPDTSTGSCSLKWLIRAPSGAMSEGPAGGQPWDINVRNVAVGDAGSAAVKVQIPSGRTQVLFAGDATIFGRAQDIDEDGEVAGYLSLQNKFCGQATAVSWDRDGRMQRLPHLAGQVSSRASAIGDDVVVGQSGPGLYCADPYSETERAVIWRGQGVTDLNSLIPAWLGITLTRAVGVNHAGQIVALGFRSDEALTECPVLSWDDDDNPILDYSKKCHNFYTYVLTPAH